MDDRTAESVLLHAVGAHGDGNTIGWRNYYASNADDAACCDAVSRGWMTSRPSPLAHGVVLYHATPEGFAHAAALSGKAVAQ